MIAILCYDLFAVPCFIITNLRLYINIYKKKLKIAV